MTLRPDEPLPRVVNQSELVRKAERLMADEQAACRSCQEGWLPRHFRSFIKDGVLYQTPCGSNSRVFDPTTGTFTGYAHCTCDYCF